MRRPRVCILVNEITGAWVPFYVEAFRQRCEVITVGRSLAPEFLGPGGWASVAAPAQPNDIAADSSDAVELLGLLPAGWDPDLVVVIQSPEPRFHNLARIQRPTAYVSVDTWHDWKEFVAARACDFVFAAQRVFLPYLRVSGVPSVQWLPLACAPAHHRPTPSPLLYDLVFVGTTKYIVNEQRVARLLRLAEHFRVAREEIHNPADVCAIYCASRLVFNSSISQDINMRVFEVMATGRPLLTNRDAAVNGLDELFEENTHYIGYDDEDLIDRARSYLGNPAACEAMGKAARALVLERHTYTHRVDTLLSSVQAAVPGLGQMAAPLIRAGSNLNAYVPFGARTVVDIGMGLRHSKHALRPRGVTRYIGVARSVPQQAQRKGSYDETVLWPFSPPSGSVNAIFWDTPAVDMPSPEEVLAFAHAALDEGGSLVLRQSTAEMQSAGLALTFDAWTEWAYQRQFHLMIFEAPQPSEAAYVLLLRKFTRTLHDLCKEIHDRWPGGRLSPLSEEEQSA